MESIFTIHSFEIECRINEPIKLIPFGDIHYGPGLCDMVKWMEFCDWAKKQRNIYFLGMGDYLDLASFHERDVLSSPSLHEFTIKTLDKLYQDQSDKFYETIKFMKGRLLGMIEGNHHGVFSNSNFTTTQYKCQKLGAKYLGVSAFIRLHFKYGKKRTCLDIWCHHGRGASRLVGGSLNTVQQMIDCADADIYLMGHDHKKSAATKTKLVLTGGRGCKLNSKKVLLCRTGSFLKGYVPEEPSYVARGAMSPTDLGVVKIEMTPKRNKVDNIIKGKIDSFYVDIHASI